MQPWSEFVERLYAQNQFAIKLGLESMQRALALEGLPGPEHRAILVAGTNGKGTTCAYLSSILQVHGLRVGLYTSPHLISLRERFRIDGQPLDQDAVLSVGCEVLEGYGSTGEGRLCLTFFELTTLMAVKLFAAAEVDVAIYEVGLGGRLDAVNAVPASMTVITTIDLDHRQYLGDTLGQIAAEKCGIMRAGVPSIVGHQDHSEARAVIEARAPRAARFYGRDFNESGCRASLEGHPRTTMRNVATAIEAAQVYLGAAFEPALVDDALACTRWPGRMDERVLGGVGGERRILFDAAHNPAGVRALFAYLECHQIVVSAIVCGAVKDKDLGAMFAILDGRDVPVFGCLLNNPRGAGADELTRALRGANLQGVGTLAWAMEASAELASQPSGRTLVFGSIYLLGECMEHFGIEVDSLASFIRA